MNDAVMPAVCEDRWNDQPVVRLTLPGGDTAVIALHGAQVVSWSTPSTGEHLYLSPRAVWDGRSAVRGGVPICFPQFNQRGPLAKHGFARNLPWSLESSGPLGEGVQAVLVLRDDVQTRAWWPHGFEARLIVQLAPGTLRIALDLHNSGVDAWSFTGALHSYLRVPDIDLASLSGLEGLARWDAVSDVRDTQSGAITFDGEYDSVFAATEDAMLLRDADSGFTLVIEHSASWGNVVVWNPGAALCAQLKDMPQDGWRNMLCVEAACVDQPVTLQAGARWNGWQQLSAVRKQPRAR